MTKPINKPIPYHHTEQFRAEAALRIFIKLSMNSKTAVRLADELIAALDKKS